MKSEVFNIDCMEGMKQYPDKYFELAIVDPPYGILNVSGKNIGGKNCAKPKEYNMKWDFSPPKKEYFIELQRVSVNQIVFGANHFISLIPLDSPCWIVWDKDNSGNFADCELAWTSFETAVRKVKFRWNGMIQSDMKNKEERLHPTQKPVALYRWLLTNYAKQGDKILDTHLGSGSSRIAAHQLGFDFTGYEIDTDYFEAAEKRFKLVTSQEQIQFPKTG